MSSSPATLLIAAVVAGVASSAVTVTLIDDDGTAAAEGGATSAQELDSLKRLVETVQDRQADLDRQFSDLQLDVLASAGNATSGGAGPEPLTASHEELAMLRQEVAALSTKVGGESVEPFMIETVSDALQTIRDQEDKEREEQWAARMEERNEERLEELTEELALDGYQQGQLKQLMDDHATKRDEIMDSARESGDFDGLRDAFTELREGEEATLALFLTPSQLEALEEMGGARAATGGGGFGRGGGGPGFGGGGR
jgi:hypothetical protein